MRKLTSNGQKVKSSYKGKEQNRDNSPALLYSFNHSQLATHNRSPNPKLHQKYMEDSPPECYSRTNDYAVEQRRKSINSNEILEPFLTNLQKRKKQPITLYHPQESRTAYNAYPEVDDDENRNSYSRISEHYKQIQYILQEENTNLKQHNEYLIRVIGKLQEKQRSSQYKMQEYKHRIFQLEKDRELYEVQRKQLEAHIERIEALVEKEDERRTSDPNQFSPLLTGEKIGNDMMPNRQQNGQTIESLNDQCQALLYQYKKTGNPELRKECIKKLKQIRTKKIKKNNQPMAKGIQHSYQQGKEFHRNNYQQYRK